MASRSAPQNGAPGASPLQASLTLPRNLLPATKSFVPSPLDKAPIRQNTCGCGQLAAPFSAGPFLRFAGVDPATNMWRGSALFVCKTLLHEKPVLTLEESGTTSTIEGLLLYTYGDWNIWRYGLEFASGPEAKNVTYSLTPESEKHTFVVPGEQQVWHWGFYSCNGFSSDISMADQLDKWHGFSPLWDDLLKQHEENPFHLLVGGGDQLYCDDVFQVGSLKKWLEYCRSDKTARDHHPFSEDMAQEVEAYYFHHYCTHFGSGAFGRALASIPQIMTWDDHDIFDGFGSYPASLQTCEVFQGIFMIARKFFLLFQQHSTDLLMKEHDIRDHYGITNTVLLGPRVAMFLPDQRSERSQNQVIPVEAYMMNLLELYALPDTVRHVVIVATVPVVYPHLGGSEKVLSIVQDMARLSLFGWLLRKTGVSNAIMSQFDEADLLDDLNDHWNGPAHAEERRFMIQQLQMLAKSRSFRISFVSGDVHLTTVGRLFTDSSRAKKAPENDFRLMYQIVSSAIGNSPPPDGLVTALSLFAGKHKTDKYTKHEMLKLFNYERPKKFKLWNRRNWCEVSELQGEGLEKGALKFSIHVEAERATSDRDAVMRSFDVVVPSLERKLLTRKDPKFYDRYGRF